MVGSAESVGNVESVASVENAGSDGNVKAQRTSSTDLKER